MEFGEFELIENRDKAPTYFLFGVDLNKHVTFDIWCFDSCLEQCPILVLYSWKEITGNELSSQWMDLKLRSSIVLAKSPNSLLWSDQHSQWESPATHEHT